jgi:hypothetical protein
MQTAIRLPAYTVNKRNIQHFYSSTVLDIIHRAVRVRVRVTLQLTVSQSVCLGVQPNLGLLTRDIIFFFF